MYERKWRRRAWGEERRLSNDHVLHVLTRLFNHFRVTFTVLLQLGLQLCSLLSQSLQLLQQRASFFLHRHTNDFNFSSPVKCNIDLNSRMWICIFTAQFKPILTVSWRPTFAFSTAFCRDVFRCFASETLKSQSRNINTVFLNWGIKSFVNSRLHLKCWNQLTKQVNNGANSSIVAFDCTEDVLKIITEHDCSKAGHKSMIHRL